MFKLSTPQVVNLAFSLVKMGLALLLVVVSARIEVTIAQREYEPGNVVDIHSASDLVSLLQGLGIASGVFLIASEGILVFATIKQSRLLNIVYTIASTLAIVFVLISASVPSATSTEILSGCSNTQSKCYECPSTTAPSTCLVEAGQHLQTCWYYLDDYTVVCTTAYAMVKEVIVLMFILAGLTSVGTAVGCYVYGKAESFSGGKEYTPIDREEVLSTKFEMVAITDERDARKPLLV